MNYELTLHCDFFAIDCLYETIFTERFLNEQI